MSDLEVALLDAHKHRQGADLARLYARAAKDHAHEPERAAFYLTHAYVFALEAGLQEAEDYRQTLKSWGREE